VEINRCKQIAKNGTGQLALATTRDPSLDLTRDTGTANEWTSAGRFWKDVAYFGSKYRSRTVRA
jgi:hypothetical protein